MKDTEVKIIKTNESKVIFEFETIAGVEIYYMTDGTCYPSSEISLNTKISDLSKKSTYDTILESNVKKYEQDLDSVMKNFVSSMSAVIMEKFNKEKKEKENKKIFKIFGWTITFTKSK